MFEDNIDENTKEVYIKGIIQAEVNNHSSHYFGETFFVTIKAKALGEIWYKVKTGYQIGLLNNVSVWFKEDELDFDI